MQRRLEAEGGRAVRAVVGAGLRGGRQVRARRRGGRPARRLLRRETLP
jgi:hypothetical protein